MASRLAKSLHTLSACDLFHRQIAATLINFDIEAPEPPVLRAQSPAVHSCAHPISGRSPQSQKSEPSRSPRPRACSLSASSSILARRSSCGGQHVCTQIDIKKGMAWNGSASGIIWHNAERYKIRYAMDAPIHPEPESLEVLQLHCGSCQALWSRGPGSTEQQLQPTKAMAKCCDF